MKKLEEKELRELGNILILNKFPYFPNFSNMSVIGFNTRKVNFHDKKKLETFDIYFFFNFLWGKK